MAEFERKHNKSLSNNPRALGRLRAACEKAKKNLSSTHETSVEIDCLSEGIDFSTTINRATFVKLNMDLFESCLEPVANCLKDAKIAKSKVHEIVLIGGSTRIPMVQQLLTEFFNCEKQLCKGINPDEAVAYGAASHAAVLAGVTGKKKHVLCDVTPLSLGVRLETGEMNVVVPRNTAIATKINNRLSTALHNQTATSFRVFEGESNIANQNNFLGKFILARIRPAPRGVPKFDTVFDIDADGILTVSAEDTDTRNKNQVTITNHSANLSEQEINRMVNEAQKYIAQDEAVMARNKLKNYVDEVKNRLIMNESRVLLAEKRKLVHVVKLTEDWLDWNNNMFGEATMFAEKIERMQNAYEAAFKRLRRTSVKTKTSPKKP